MAGNYVNISSFVDDLVPEHVATSYPELIEFIKVYALYLETKSGCTDTDLTDKASCEAAMNDSDVREQWTAGNGSAFYLNQLAQQRNIDLVEEHLLNELQNEIGTPIPRSFAADPRLFYKHLVDFYRSRGTPESIKSFFRLIYDDEVEIYFPKDDMLIPSDGKWFDHSDDLKQNHLDFLAGTVSELSHTPAYTYTVSANTYILDGNDDHGFHPKYDDGLVFVNDVFVDTPEVIMTHFRMDDDHWHGRLIFTSQLVVGDIVTIFRRGLFTVTDGFLSEEISPKYLQDSYFYQKFSYVLKTGKNIDEWKSAFTRLIHPAGFIFFGEIFIFITFIEEVLQNNNVTTFGLIPRQPGFQFELLHKKLLAFAAAVVTYELHVEDKTALDYDRERIPKYNYVRGYTATLSELGTFVEKEFKFNKGVNTNFDLWDHFGNVKFSNWRPIYDYSEFTFEDVINKSIGTQIGCKVEISGI